MKVTRELKVAVLVILSIVLFYWGFSFLKGKNLFDATTKLYVVYDNVAGLAPSSPVTVNGLVVGKINKIDVLENGKMLVEMVITNEQVQISKSSLAEIQGMGIVGGREIAIIVNFADKNYAVSGDTLKAANKLGLADELAVQMEPLKVKVEKLLDNANQLFEGVNSTLDKSTQTNLRLSIASLQKTLDEFSQVAKNANELVTSNKSKLNATFTNFEKTSANLTKISDSLAKANLASTVKNLEKTLANVNDVLQDVEQGKGSMGKLLKDDALYVNVTKTAKELELLLQDLRLNPTRYINVSFFGKKNKPYIVPNESSTKIKEQTTK